MTKIKTSELTGAALDWAVAKCEGVLAPDGVHLSDEYCDSLHHDQDGGFSTDWAQGGPIIEREGITISRRYIPFGGGRIDWTAQYFEAPHTAFELHRHFGPTPLIAAMRCLVASKLGDEVEVPDELP